MISFLLRWVFRFAVLAVLALVFVEGWGGALVGWLIFCYLLFRALPGVRGDVRALLQVGKRVKLSSGNARF